MATFVDFDILSEDILAGEHNFNAAGDTIMVYLTNNTPSVTADAVLADLAGITEQNGYAAADIQNDMSQTGGTATVTGVDVTVTATGAVGPFRYVVIYNSTATTKTNPLISYYDYGSEISLANGEEFLIDIGASVLTAAFS